MTKVISFVTMFTLAAVSLALVAFLFSAPFAALAMVLLGVAHSFNDIVPALGFVETWILTFIISMIGGKNNSALQRVNQSLGEE